LEEEKERLRSYPDVSFDAAEVDQPHLVVKVRFLKHALLSEVPGTVGDGI
jgi:hypothetical protein